MKLRSEYDGREAEVSAACGISFDPAEDKAQQQFKEECDINMIAQRFGLTGMLPVTARPLSYAEFEGIFDFQSAMNAVREAGEAFLGLPAKVRDRFQNDPQKFLEFCNTAKIADYHELGLTREGFKLPEAVVPPPAS